MRGQSSEPNEERKHTSGKSADIGKRPIRLRYWLLVIVWILLIFILSHQRAAVSDALSGGVLNWLLPYLPIGAENIPVMHVQLRKSAHFIAYFILGVLVVMAVSRANAWSIQTCIYALLISAVFAMTDEVHQLFVPGRSGEIRDVMIDSIGASIGISCWSLWKFWRKN